MLPLHPPGYSPYHLPTNNPFPDEISAAPQDDSMDQDFVEFFDQVSLTGEVMGVRSSVRTNVTTVNIAIDNENLGISGIYLSAPTDEDVEAGYDNDIAYLEANTNHSADFLSQGHYTLSSTNGHTLPLRFLLTITVEEETGPEFEIQIDDPKQTAIDIRLFLGMNGTPEVQTRNCTIIE